MKLTRQQIQTLVQLVADTRLEELDCDEMMRVLTACADKLARGEATDVNDDAMIHYHLEICGDCREEFEMLQRIADEGDLREDVSH